MLRISFTRQNSKHRLRPLTRRFRPELNLVHRAQITLREARTKRKYLPPLGPVLVRLTNSQHVQRSFGRAIWKLDRHISQRSFTS